MAKYTLEVNLRCVVLSHRIPAFPWLERLNIEDSKGSIDPVRFGDDEPEVAMKMAHEMIHAYYEDGAHGATEPPVFRREGYVVKQNPPAVAPRLQHLVRPSYILKYNPNKGSIWQSELMTTGVTIVGVEGDSREEFRLTKFAEFTGYFTQNKIGKELNDYLRRGKIVACRAIPRRIAPFVSTYRLNRLAFNLRIRCRAESLLSFVKTSGFTQR